MAAVRHASRRDTIDHPLQGTKDPKIILLGTLSTPRYTLPELVDAPGLQYERLDGETEILPGVLVVPTPGHTTGHQSLIVRRHDGTVVVAGQSHDTATAYGSDVLAWQAARDHHFQPLPPMPAWIDRLQQLDPARVVFAHDNAVWTSAELFSC
jgi:N-acyl homoserine lactone hydrolase